MADPTPVINPTVSKIANLFQIAGQLISIASPVVGAVIAEISALSTNIEWTPETAAQLNDEIAKDQAQIKFFHKAG